MSKPDWKDAPEWAMWLACDLSGIWYWFSHKPEKKPSQYWFLTDEDYFCDDSHVAQAGRSKKRCVNWRDTPEPRP